MAQRPIVHLFIGLHKTGSTAIRFMLDVHRDLLPNYGFYLPLATWTRYIKQSWNGGHNNIAWELFKQRPIPAYGSIADLVNEIAEHPTRQHILLTEDLDTAAQEHIETLRQALSGCDVRIIIFVRNQVDWIQSSSGEDQKWFGAPSFDNWCRSHVGPDTRLDLHALCTRWKQAFGTVTVRCYEEIQSRVFDAFLECCQAPDGLRTALAARGIPRINSTHGDLPLALIHHASEQALALGMRASYFNATISPAILTAFKQLRQPPKRRAPFDAAIAETLGALMRSSNQRLADDFGLALGPAYLNPTFDSTPAPEASFSLTAEEVAGLILASCTDVNVRTAMGMRPSATAAAHDGSRLPAEIRALADRLDPWGTADAPPASRLDELLVAVVPYKHRLYLERHGATAAAFRQPAGVMEKIADLTPGEWKALKLGLQRRAHLNLVSWNNVREGEVIAGPDQTRLWLRAVPTDGGEILMLEPIDAVQDQARLDLAQNAGSAAEDAYALYALASEITQAGDWNDDRLVPLLERAIGLDSELYPAHRLLGVIAERRGDLDTTIRCLNEAAKRKTDWAVCFDLGRVRLRLDQPIEAIAHFEQAAALDPSRAITLHMLGQTYARQGDLERALAATERAVALNPDDPRWQFDLGLLKFQTKDYEGARARFEQAVAGLPNWAPAAHLLAHSVRQLQGDLAALPLYERVIALDATDAAGHYDLGRVHAALGDHQTAIECFKRATALNPGESRWLYDLGHAKFQAGDHGGATLALWRAADARPDWAPPVHLLAHTVRQQQGLRAALPLYARVVALDPDNAAAHYDLGHAKYELGDAKASVACFERAVAARPENARWRFELGRARFVTGDYAAAEPLLRQTVAALPASAEATHLLAHTVRRREGDLAALPLYERVVALDGNNACARYDLGMVHCGLGNYSAAITQLERATTLNPNEPQWGIDLGRAQLEVGDYISAETWLRQTVAALPESAAATHLLAHAVKRQRGGAASLPLYERVVALDGDNAMARYDLGHIKYELGDYTAALTHFERAATLSPNWAEAHYYLGLTTCRLQGAADALPHFTTATAIAPSWAEARYELAVRVLRTGGPRAAQAHFEMVTELAPTWAEPWRQAGACARLMERWPEATRLFKRAFDLGTSEKGFLSDLADAACRTKQWQIAVDALRRLQPIAPNRLAVDKHLGICLRLVGQLAESEQLLSACIAANPDWPGARFELGITLLGLGRPREARNELKRASELQPEWAAPRDVLRDLDSRSSLRLAS